MRMLRKEVFRKRGKKAFCMFLFVVIALIILVVLPSASSQLTVNETAKINLAKKWLDGQVRGHWPSSTDENALALLSLADDAGLASEGKTSLNAKSSSGECWPALAGGACNVKSTSLALLALKAFGEDTSGIETWLLGKKKSFTEGVSWYMQLETLGAAQCNITYGDKSNTVNIASNKKISSITGRGDCFSKSTAPAPTDYWLKLTTKKECFERTFTVTCNSDFSVSFPYIKGSTIFVSSQIISGYANQSIDASIVSYCLGAGTACEYEGTLWAAYALQKIGRSAEVSTFLPYLSGQADANAIYLPNAFLYALTGSTDFVDRLLAAQNAAGYWQVSSSLYYDTAIAILMLSGYGFGNVSSAKSYLFSVQRTDGSWQSSVRDTALIVYAIMPPTPALIPGILPEIPVNKSECELKDGICKAECADNENSVDYDCFVSGEVCCMLKTCAELGGEVCGYGMRCSEGETKDSSDGVCCIGGKCIEKLKTCTELNGITCEANERCTGRVETALGTNYCCVGGECKKPGLWWLWLILIAAVIVVGYLQREKLKKFFGKRPPRPSVPPGFPPRLPPAYPQRPAYPPGYPVRPLPSTIPSRPAVRPIPAKPITRPSAKHITRPSPLPPSKILAPKPSVKKTAEEELQETLKKLRKLTK